MGQFSVTAAGDEWTVISKSPLDREVKDKYTLNIIATDGRFQTSANVEVHVFDLNDNSPLCDQVSQAFSRRYQYVFAFAFMCVSSTMGSFVPVDI